MTLNTEKAKIKQVLHDSWTRELILSILMIGGKVANGEISSATMEDREIHPVKK